MKIYYCLPQKQSKKANNNFFFVNTALLIIRLTALLMAKPMAVLIKQKQDKLVGSTIITKQIKKF